MKKSEKHRYSSLLVLLAVIAAIVFAVEGISVLSILVALFMLVLAGLVITIQNRRPPEALPATPQYQESVSPPRRLPKLMGLSPKIFESMVLPRLARRKVNLSEETLLLVSRLDRALLAPLCIGIILMLVAAPRPTVIVSLPRFHLSTTFPLTTATTPAKPPATHKPPKAHAQAPSKHPPPKREPQANAQTSTQSPAETVNKSVDKAFGGIFNNWHPTRVAIWWLPLVLGFLTTVVGIALALRWLWTFWLIDEDVGIIKVFLPPVYIPSPEDVGITHKVSLLGVWAKKPLLGKLLGYGQVRVNTLLDPEEEKPLKKISPLPDPYGFTKDAMSLIDPGKARIPTRQSMAVPPA